MIENLIRERVHFTETSRTGFHKCICPVCNDYQDRGGFKFEAGEIFYNCFNCGTAESYVENSGNMFPGFRKVLQAFGFDKEEVQREVNKGFFKVKQEDPESKIISLADVQPPKEKKAFLVTPEIQVPPTFHLLGSTDIGTPLQERIIDYLIGRKIRIQDVPFMFSIDPKHHDFVIIPFYRNGKFIFWQGRNIDKNAPKKKRYDNCLSSKENIIYNIDALSRGTGPLFVSEGVFDAIPLDGIALIGSKLNQAKTDWLMKSKRDLIFIIDKDNNGKKLAYKVLSYGWKITFAPDFTNDVNDSIIKYGELWTIHQLFKNIPKTDFEAKTQIEMYCK